MTAEEFLAKLDHVRRAGSNAWTARCPAHDDDRNSLSVTATTDRLLVNCFVGCQATEITAAVGCSVRDLFLTPNGHHGPRMLVATYDYVAGDGALIFQVQRFTPKDFRQRRPDGRGGWLYSLDGIRRPIYRLPDLAEQPRVYWTEGEQDADRVAALGLAATTAAGGVAGWRDEYAGQLEALGVRELIILPDHDAPGERYAMTVARRCAAAGLEVRVLRLPGLPVKGDVSDWLAAGHTRDELEALLAATPPLTAEDLAARDEEAPGAGSATLGRGLGDFVAVPFAQLEPLVEGLLSSDGGGWIGGEEKLCKTLYAIDEALSIGLGLPVCQRFAVPQRRRVLFIEEEDSPRRTQTRVRAQLRGRGLDPDDPGVQADLNSWLRFAVWEGFTFDGPEMLARLEKTLTEFQPSVVYLDVFRKLTSKDLNKADQAGVILAVLDDLRRRFGVTFRVVHHFRKSQGFRTGRGSQELGGSFVLGAWAENSLFFEPIGRKHGAVRVEIQSKDAPAQPAFSLQVEAEGPMHAPTLLRLKAIDLTAASAAAELDDKVLAAVGSLDTVPALAGKPGVPLPAICRAVSRSDRPVRDALKRLQEAGLVDVVGKATKQAALYGLIGQ